MKKRITALFVAILFCFLFLTGCGSDDKPSCLECAEYGQGPSGTVYGVYYDLETKVMYIISYHGGMSPMYNADGSLKLYQEDDV